MRVAECSTELASRGGGAAAPQAQSTTSTHNPWTNVSHNHKGGHAQPELEMDTNMLKRKVGRCRLTLL